MLFIARSIGCRSFAPPEFPLSGRGFETSTGDIEAVILQQACANWTQSSLHIGVERHINVAHVGEPAKGLGDNTSQLILLHIRLFQVSPVCKTFRNRPCELVGGHGEGEYIGGNGFWKGSGEFIVLETGSVSKSHVVAKKKEYVIYSR